LHLAYEAPWGRINWDRIGGGKSEGGRDTTKLVAKDAKGESVSAETELRGLAGGNEPVHANLMY
jgi:hypothetical protein